MLIDSSALLVGALKLMKLTANNKARDKLTFLLIFIFPPLLIRPVTKVFIFILKKIKIK